jgi:uncharacterized membrane protein YkvA (DUF1232 family)
MNSEHPYAHIENLSQLPFDEIRNGEMLINALTEKINDLNPQLFQDQLVEHRVRLLLDILRESFADRYQDLSLLAFARIIVAIDYFIRSDDDTPDTQAGGYEDDLRILQEVFSDFSGELEIFKEWRSRES